MTRSVPEWIGKTADTPIPPRVKIRVFERYGGKCHISGRKIMPGDAWECDHVIALANGGQNRESNLAPALKDKHREKTAQDVKTKSKIARIRAKRLGVTGGRKKPASRFVRKINGSTELRSPDTGKMR